MVGACRHAASSSDPSMTISEVTAVTTADLTGSVWLVCWEAATHGTDATMQDQTHAIASARIRSGEYRGAGRLSIGCPAGLWEYPGTGRSTAQFATLPIGSPRGRKR